MTPLRPGDRVQWNGSEWTVADFATARTVILERPIGGTSRAVVPASWVTLLHKAARFDAHTGQQLAAVATLAEEYAADLLTARKQLRSALNTIDRLCRQNVKLKTENAIQAIAMAATGVSVSSCSGVRSRSARTSARTPPRPTEQGVGKGAARGPRAGETAPRSASIAKSERSGGGANRRGETKRHAARKGS